MQLWYAHMLTTVFLMTEPGGRLPSRNALPHGSGARGTREAAGAGEVGSEATTALAYTERGWPCFECMVSMLGKTTSQWAWPLVVNVGAGMGSSVRLPPLAPDDFAALLDTRHFTSGADKAVVLELYCTTARAVMGGAAMLKFGGLQWGDADLVQLCAWLRHSKHLREISLVGNQIGDTGVVALADLVSQGCLPNLRRLNLSFNKISLAGFQALGAAINGGPRGSNLPNLEWLATTHNLVTNEELRGVLPTTSELRVRRAAKWREDHGV